MEIYMLDESALRLGEHYYKYVEFDLPIYAVLDDMAKSMDARGKTYFMIPKNKSKTYQDLYFHFKIEKAGLHNEVHYVYVGITNKSTI